ncbi:MULTISPECIES: gluconeogenesis factor YvcK family protein [Planktothricoides]|uniref:Putative gluconeogenesis factor n=2 Tax=Planktothricoides raciborskii TaxID=132608 RepID=A0AAU8J6W3_9CYAN|nr:MULTISPECIES: gluconeogenesis factor YvcK family protein [Planktothricoides]KOR38325.1 hypothetical protein AM228_01785 [Planktothricoides sp. SR001]MBD2543392.1 YvcK family protein [Planktothricoides raciborskii FACHB-1370]MBD2581691.1 YvcK family protein [Planktothricoides raciborskii FACHB-1261]
MANGFLRKAIQAIEFETRSFAAGSTQNLYSRRPSNRVNQWAKWLSPGLFVKRWLLISVLGVILSLLGLAIWIRLNPIFRVMQFLETFLSTLTTVIPNYISGPLVLVMGILLLLWAHGRTVGAIAGALRPDNDEELVDLLLNHRRLNRGPKIVVVGGGTGLSTLLRGLKHYSSNITAIVTVADDGGSSGRLRRENGVLPPGDIRNCLSALAAEEKLLTELFKYRFRAGKGLEGHSFGNLFLTAMTDITGDLERAIAASSQVLAVRGEVLPATLCDVNLWAELADGRCITGESSISEAGGKIVKIGCIPANPPALPKALQAIEEADFIILGPGSLYTSVIPNLLVPQITEAIDRKDIPKIYVCNIMTQPGETQDYSVADHIKAIDLACGRQLFNAVLVQSQSPSAQALIRYAQDNSHPVFLDREAIKNSGRQIVNANVMEEDPDTGYVRHNPQLLARVLLRWYSRMQLLKTKV